MTSHCQFYYYKIRRLFYWLSKFFVLIAVGLMSTKHGFMLASVSLIQRAELITSKLITQFLQTFGKRRETSLLVISSAVCMESTSKYWIPVFNILEKANISVILAHPKYTKLQKGNKTDRKDAK